MLRHYNGGARESGGEWRVDAASVKTRALLRQDERDGGRKEKANRLGSVGLLLLG